MGYYIYYITADNSIGVEGTKDIVEVLKLNKTLTELNLSSKHMHLMCAYFVFDNKFVADNSIDTEGAKVLAEALKVNKSLARLNLRDTNTCMIPDKLFQR